MNVLYLFVAEVQSGFRAGWSSLGWFVICYGQFRVA